MDEDKRYTGEDNLNGGQPGDEGMEVQDTYVPDEGYTPDPETVPDEEYTPAPETIQDEGYAPDPEFTPDQEDTTVPVNEDGQDAEDASGQQSDVTDTPEQFANPGVDHRYYLNAPHGTGIVDFDALFEALGADEGLDVGLALHPLRVHVVDRLDEERIRRGISVCDHLKTAFPRAHLFCIHPLSPSAMRVLSFPDAGPVPAGRTFIVPLPFRFRHFVPLRFQPACSTCSDCAAGLPAYPAGGYGKMECK